MSTDKAWEQLYKAEAVSPWHQIFKSKYHFSIKGTKLLGINNQECTEEYRQVRFVKNDSI